MNISLHFLSFVAGICRCGQGVNPATNIISARTLYHPDGTRTESVRDPITREQVHLRHAQCGDLPAEVIANDRGAGDARQ